MALKKATAAEAREAKKGQKQSGNKAGSLNRRPRGRPTKQPEDKRREAISEDIVIAGPGKARVSKSGRILRRPARLDD